MFFFLFILASHLTIELHFTRTEAALEWSFRNKSNTFIYKWWRAKRGEKKTSDAYASADAFLATAHPQLRNTWPILKISRVVFTSSPRILSWTRIFWKLKPTLIWATNPEKINLHILHSTLSRFSNEIEDCNLGNILWLLS